MSITYKIDPDRKAIFVYGTGALTKQAVLGYFSDLFRDADFNPDYDHLIDYSAITEVDMDSVDLVELVETTKSSDPRKGRIAFVIGNLAGREFLANFYTELAHLSKGQTMQSFKTREEAESWLGLT